MSTVQPERPATRCLAGVLFLTCCLVPAGAARGEPPAPFFVEIATSCCAAAGAELEITCEQGDTTWICLGSPLEGGDRLITTVVQARQGQRDSEAAGTEACDYYRPACGAEAGTCLPAAQLQIESTTCEVRRATGPLCRWQTGAGGAGEIACEE